MIVTGPYPITALDGPGAVHIDRIVREVIAGVPGRPAAIRRDADRDYAEYVDEQNAEWWA